MITLHKLKWGNCFSYGEENELILDATPITQLVGVNGAGKTSIPVMIQEVLFGKNIRGIKKQDIANRYTGIPGYWITLTFSKDSKVYVVHLNRTKTKLTLELTEDGEDISSHTSMGTYKTIGEIIGFVDFKMAAQLLYQSSTTNLEFLTATDTNRKKFLVSLLNLEKYLETHDVFKDALRDINKDILSAQATLDQVSAWVTKHSKMVLEPRELKQDIVVPEEPINRLAKIKSDLENIKSINKDIVMNNTFKKELKELDTSILNKKIEYNPDEYKGLNQEIGRLKATSDSAGHNKSKFSSLQGSKECPTCFSEIDQLAINDIVKKANDTIDSCQGKINELSDKLTEESRLKEDIRYAKRIERSFIQLNACIREDVENETLDETSLLKEKRGLEDDLFKIREDIKAIAKYNLEVSAHNSKIEVVKSQLVDFKAEKVKKERLLGNIVDEKTYVEILKNAFSTNGLLSYKIESSVKVLEDSINTYLSEFCFFRLLFSLESEKLNVRIVDDTGEIISIESLSSGELARVNISTVLAIRKVMTTLASSNINFLFLDEIVGVLDEAGKEKLSEILIRENLNTFIVSHEATHPLIPKILVEKINNISRLTDG